MSSRSLGSGRVVWWIGALGALTIGACDADDYVVGSDEQALTGIDEVDILLVVDSSASIAPAAERLKQELPRLVNAIVSGSDEDTESFPPASSVHVAVATSDMGTGAASNVPSHVCSELGDDGVFLTPAEVELSCEASYPGYLSFDGMGEASIASVDSVQCVPLGGYEGCGNEQPLESALKALWPAEDDSVTFLEGTGHGTGVNAGFLRDDSLLVVVVVSDEDDCSAEDVALFDTADFDLGPVNVRCALHDEFLFDVERYVQGLQALRAGGGDVIFGVVGGVPPEVLAEASEMRTDYASDAQAQAYYEHILEAPAMQPVVEAVDGDPMNPQNVLVPSCQSGMVTGRPPVRLVETAAAFGTRGVVGSLCEEDFGATTGALLRVIADSLVDAAESGDE